MPCDVFLMIVFCSGISHSFSNQRDKHLSKLTRLAINNRRFDGRALESPAPIANQVRYICLQKSCTGYHFGLLIHQFIICCILLCGAWKKLYACLQIELEKRRVICNCTAHWQETLDRMHGKFILNFIGHYIYLFWDREVARLTAVFRCD